MFMDLPTIRQLITLIQPTRTSVSGFIAGHICVPAGGGEDRVRARRLTVVARSKPSSGKKHKPQRSTAARLDIDGAHARGRETEQARVSRRSIVIAAVVAAATIVSGSLAFQFLTGWSACIFRRLSRRCEDLLRQQQHLRHLPSGRGRTLALVAAWARHAACDR
jgi:hypothetical protein